MKEFVREDGTRIRFFGDYVVNPWAWYVPGEPTLEMKYPEAVRALPRPGRSMYAFAINATSSLERLTRRLGLSPDEEIAVSKLSWGEEPETAAPAKGKQDFDGLIDGVGYKQSMDDNSKAVLSLVPPTQRRGVARVLMFGEKKYARGQWMRGMSWCEVMDAMQRHIDAFMLGEDNDPESGLPHLDHAACCQAFMSWYTSGPRREEYARFDDRLFNRKDPRSDAA